jgi:chaperonin GroES
MDMNKIQPLGDRVVLEPIESETRTSGGIIIPDTAKEKPVMGRVIAVGPGGMDSEGKYLPMHVKVGDTVLHNKWGGQEFKLKGKDLMILKESDLLGIVS